MQLQDSINHGGGSARAVHILELLAEALEQAGVKRSEQIQ
jgi:hypothetical protein